MEQFEVQHRLTMHTKAMHEKHYKIIHRESVVSDAIETIQYWVAYSKICMIACAIPEFAFHYKKYD